MRPDSPSLNAAGIDLYRYLAGKAIRLSHHPDHRQTYRTAAARDVFTCKATVTEARFKIAMDFEIRRFPNGELCTRGNSEQLAVKYPEMELEFEIPVEIQKALGFQLMDARIESRLCDRL